MYAHGEPIAGRIHPEAGRYKMRMFAYGPWVAVRVWFDDDRHEPDNPENKLDRPAIWRVSVDGVESPELEKVWPRCHGEPVNNAEYLFLLKDAEHRREHRPHELIPRKK